jgi:benzoyl-CoA reductase/2-hydroxyglutaryl-CoA dehydratase subunit BcrC/BadD/HgdB
MLEIFQTWYENPQEYVRAWKERTGGKVLGVFGAWAPEEMLAAAGLLSFPIGFSRPRTALSYDFLDGVIGPAGDQRLNSLSATVSYRYVLAPLSDRRNPSGLSSRAAQLADFQKSLEDWTGRKITAGDLDQGIAVMNTHRRLLRSVWEIRKKIPPPLTGLEALYLAGSGQWVDRREFNRVLGDNLEKELPNRRIPGGSRIRLLLAGDGARNAAWLSLVESLEGVVVIDDRDWSGPYCWDEVLPGEDRLAAIAARYLEQPGPEKPERARALARDWRAQGALILQGPGGPDPGEDLPALRQALDGVGVPSLVLEAYDEAAPGSLKIRVEAFLETLRPEDLF